MNYKNEKYLITEDNLPEQYKPISSLGYIGYQLLFFIPIIGWILIIMYAFGKEDNVNVRNLARSQIYTCVIWVILYLLFKFI